MGYMTRGGRMARGRQITLMTARTLSADGVASGTTRELGDKTLLRCTITITGVTGTPSIVLWLHTAETETGSTWNFASVDYGNDVNSFNANGTYRVMFYGLDRWVRVFAEVSGGTANVAITAEAL